LSFFEIYILKQYKKNIANQKNFLLKKSERNGK